MSYIALMICLLFIYIATIFAMKYMKNVKLWNFVFGCIVFGCYISLMITIFKHTGFNDWNFKNTLPTANISPFMFSLMPIILIIPKSIKKHFYLLIALLSVGMFLSTIFNCCYFANIGYKFHWHFMLDYISHFALSAWGIYLIASNQIQLKKKSCLISACIIFAFITTMLILNVIFDTAFCGLSLNGKHNIYNYVFVKNSYLSALIYYFGVVIVLLLGYVLQLFVQRKTKKSQLTNKN